MSKFFAVNVLKRLEDIFIRVKPNNWFVLEPFDLINDFRFFLTNFSND